MHELLAQRVQRRIRELFPDVEGVEIKIDVPPRPEMGDYSTNLAMTLAPLLKMAPREIAGKIVDGFSDRWIEKIEIAGPGFINFFISKEGWAEWFSGIFSDPEKLIPDLGKGRKVHLEFVSANPTGPLHVGHGRGAALGDTLTRLLRATGFQVLTEYYINDAGRQITKLGESVYLRYRELFGEEITLEEDHYKGEYIIEIARKIRDLYGDRFIRENDLEFFKKFAAEEILNGIKEDLDIFRVKFDSWFSERSLYDRGVVDETVEILKSKDLIYEDEGAIWFRSSLFGDEKDRVIRRSTGEPTYFLADIAYHRLKFEGGYDLIIDIWGADHHGYEPRIRAAMKALGFDEERLKILFIQLVSLIKDGRPVSMSTRAGEFVTLRDVVEEVGVDAARFFYLLRRNDSHLDFDLDLARKKSNENPVYYVQYAHARISSIFRQGEKKGLDVKPEFFPEKLGEGEIPLLKKIADFSRIIEQSVRDLSPHRIPFYLVELARQFHQYYNETRVLTENVEERKTRLALIEVVKYILREGLEIIGVEAPEKM